ncbi:MAG: hypothetical protein ND895_13040 [Pyrinomonadaceae bacterium]|nr:hypothetical protein [Pyrinomonadaceae bacterium]
MISSLRYLKRNRFFTGKFMTVEDLTAEQEYVREKQKRHNRYLHGFGVVFGLEVSKSGSAVVISTGLAIDCQGNEIVVPEPLELELPGRDLGSTLFLSISYIERETDPVPSPSPDCSEMENSRVEEGAVAVFEKGNANYGHRHFKGRWRSCGESHGLTIARLRLSSGQWRIDRRLHVPLIK